MRLPTDNQGFSIPAVVAILVGVLLAMVLGAAAGNQDVVRLVLIALPVGGVFWVLFGCKIWWLPLFFFVTLGGNFFLGFKIYVHELAVLMALAPLTAAFLMRGGKIPKQGTGYEKIVFLLLLYVSAHMMVCLSWNRLEGLGGTGNVVRRYADAIWPIAILLPILLYANFQQIRWVLNLILAAAIIRVLIGLSAVWLGREELIYIPVIKYLPPDGGSAKDLRGAGPTLVSIALVFFYMWKGMIPKMACLWLVALGSYATLLGGSRLAVVSLFLLLGMALVLYKQWFAMLTLGAIGLIAVMLINISPESLYSLPENARRAASGLVFDDRTSEDLGQTGLSNQWHTRLAEEGWKSWTESILTILVGRGVMPFDERAWGFTGGGEALFEGMITMAIRTSRFEKGIWDVLCTFGIVGLALFGACLFRVVRFLLPVLMRDRIASPAHGLGFIGLYLCLQWLLFFWIGGSFPSYAIMMGFIAMAAIKRQEGTKESQAALQAETSPGESDVPALISTNS